MSKDPAVLLYTSDFLSGTMTMTDEQVGKYIRLLCLQHQKGFLTEKDMSYICRTYDEDVYGKFVKEGDKYYNPRMREEAEKRRKYSESRKKNISKRYEKEDDNTYVAHMENENENEDTNKDLVLKENKSKPETVDEVKNYGTEIQLEPPDCEAFYDHFTSNGWKVGGKSPMKDWKAALRNWKRNKLKYGINSGSNQYGNRQTDATRRATFKHGPEQIQNLRNLEESLRKRVEERNNGNGFGGL